MNDVDSVYKILMEAPMFLATGEIVRVSPSEGSSWIGRLGRFKYSVPYSIDWRVPVGWWYVHSVRDPTREELVSITRMQRVSPLEALAACAD